MTSALDIEAYPAVRANPDRAAKLEDCMMLALAALPLRAAELQLHAWELGRALTAEQALMMWTALEDRALLTEDGR